MHEHETPLDDGLDPIERWVAELANRVPYVKGCAQGAHWMQRDADGRRCWQCTRCGHRQPFNVDGEE